MVEGKQQLQHRVIWEMFNGKIPKGMHIDHIDTNKRNNKIENLRLVTQKENNRNVGMSKNNTSGAKGVSWDKRKGSWEVYITVDYKKLRLGYYDDLELADLVASEAREKYHGEYARHK